MRFRLSTVFFVITLVAMSTILIRRNSKPKIFTIENYVDWWVLDDRHVINSKWSDQSQPPPISFAKAFTIATDITEFLNQNSTKIGHNRFELDGVALIRIKIESNCWAYEFSITGKDANDGWLELSLLLLMDGTLAIDPNAYWDELIKVVDKFDENRNVVTVVAGQN